MPGVPPKVSISTLCISMTSRSNGKAGALREQFTQAAVFLYAGAKMGHYFRADLLLRVVFGAFPVLNVLTQGVFQHCSEMPSILPGDFPHRRQQLRRSLAGELLSSRSHQMCSSQA